ncbi:MAG TPA: AbfB domain-containing protein [Sphingobacterium sp.]|nr:AbfB domain-containing protein [Sphingobacterium sp.]
MRFTKITIAVGILLSGMSLTSAQVTVYEQPGFKGKQHTYTTEGFHSLPGTIGNDVLSSVKVSPGWKVTLYEHDQNRGRKLELTSDADVNVLNTNNFNDITSNIKVERVQSGKNTLKAGEILKAGDRLVSANGQYILRMQEDDGNLCIYRFENGKQGAFVWGSMKHGFKGAKLTMQSDGNLVVTDGSNTPKWASDTHPHFDARFNNSSNKPVKLVLENDGSLKLYTASGSVVWTNTGGLAKTTQAAPVKLPDYFKLHAYSVHGKRVEKGSDFYMGFTRGSLDGKIINPNSGTVIHIEKVNIDAAKGIIALKVTNASQPDMYLSVADNKNVNIVKGTNGNKHHFTIRTPEEKEAANLSYVSFESVAFPGWFLRHQGFVLKLTQASDNNRKDIVYRQDATWLFEAVSK